MITGPTTQEWSEQVINDMAKVASRHDEEVLLWRKESYERLGFDDVMAALLAHTAIDITTMQGLLDSGCPHETAVRILMGTDFHGDDPNWTESPRILEDEDD